MKHEEARHPRDIESRVLQRRREHERKGEVVGKWEGRIKRRTRKKLLRGRGP